MYFKLIGEMDNKVNFIPIPRGVLGFVSDIKRLDDYVVISISDPGIETPTWIVKEDPKCRDILGLHFSDIDIHIDDCILFDKTHAQEILDFYGKWMEKVSTIVIHCNAGISRSPAVAAALSLIDSGDDKKIWDNRAFYPNRHVYRTIINQYHDFIGLQNETE